MMTATRIASVKEATTLERVIRDATKSYTFDCEKRWGNSLVFFQVEMNVKWGKPMYIFTCRDVWRLGGWCDKVSGCYWPEMTVKAVFANFTATSRDICPLLLHPPHTLWSLIEAAENQTRPRTTWHVGPHIWAKDGYLCANRVTGPPNQNFGSD